ncbi:MAG: hypothetical protein ABIN91_00295 [Mucilaginibacter sp.]|uniref:hypothetical protein n=1 Tax=Mucilaginibacter sp. TaxID=1882438 RepID=UPI003265D1F0
MKKLHIVPLMLLLMVVLSSCSVITGIFKAGAVVGIIAILVVIGIIFWIFSMFTGGKQ